MKYVKGVAPLLVFVAFAANLAFAQATSFDLQFVLQLNDGAHYDVLVQVKGNAGTFKMGGANFFFFYNNLALSNPVLLSAANFSGGSYNAMTVVDNGTNASVNIDLAVDNSGTTVQTTYTDVGVVRFTTTDPTGSSNLVWRTSPFTEVFLDDQSTPLPIGTLNNFNTSPLPITLATFNAVTSDNQLVRLSWITVSEIHNYGFWVQRSADKTNGFVNLEGSFIAGAGTTNARHEYSYTDATAGGAKYYYRLEQVDLDGSTNYSEAIFPSGTTGVATENVPKVFALHQNYPNPFNPSTEIRFTVEKAGPATLKVYNMLGQEIATLFSGLAQPGRYYIEKFSADKLASGVYLYRLESNNKSAVSRMLLLK